MSMTRKDSNLIAVALRDMQPMAHDVVNAMTKQCQRAAMLQHKRMCYKLALELDAAHARFRISQFMEVCGYDPNGCGGFVVAPCFSQNV